MTNASDAQDLVTQLDALHDSLMQAWLTASNSGDHASAKALKTQADRAGDQLILARQHLLTAIDSGQDVTALLAKMAGLAASIKTQQQKVVDKTAALGAVSGVLDTVGQVVTLAKKITGG